MAHGAIEVAHTWDGEPVPDGERVRIAIEAAGDHVLVRVIAPFHSDPPPPGPLGPTDGLWEHEVVEVFVAGADGRYTEIELGPYGHHLVLQLQGARRAVARCLPLVYTARIEGASWSGEAWVPRAYLPAGPHALNAYAIHGRGRERRYLAMTPLPGPMPDFHQPDRFAPFRLP